VGVYNLDPLCFWYSTPKEYALITGAKDKHADRRFHDLLEVIRLQTYVLASLKKGTTYKAFTKDFSYPWDKPSEETPAEKLDLTAEKVLEFMKSTNERGGQAQTVTHPERERL
jgi:hypothetical protein